MDSNIIINDYLLTCLAEKENISVVVLIQILNNSNDLLEEMNSPLFDVHHRILQTVDENHLKNILIFDYVWFKRNI